MVRIFCEKENIRRNGWSFESDFAEFKLAGQLQLAASCPL
jgi:hypothetical protein